MLEACERDISSFATSFVVAKCVALEAVTIGAHSSFNHRGVFPFMVEKVRQLSDRVMTKLCRECPQLQNPTLRDDVRFPMVVAEATESLVLSMAYG